MERDLLAEAENRVVNFVSFRAETYSCSGGFATIGYGINLEIQKPDAVERVLLPYILAHLCENEIRRAWCGFRITEEQARVLLRAHLGETQNELRYSLNGNSDGVWFLALPFDARLVILDMAHSMGVYNLLKFHHMWEAIKIEDWETAAAEILDSKWAKRAGRRATENSDIIRALA